MPLVSMSSLLRHALDGGYAVGYFESWNLESLLAVKDAAEQAESPVIIGFNGKFLGNGHRRVKENINHYGSLGRSVAEYARVPMALILNEADEPALLQAALDAGFNVVMHDHESCSLEQSMQINISLVRDAHAVGAEVEAELGELPAWDIGATTSAAHRDTGLPEGIPIAAGCGDQTAGFVGAGILDTGQIVDVSGTTCILGVCVDAFRCDARHKTLACVKAAVGDRYYLISVVLGGRTHNWFIEEFCAEEAERIRHGGGDVYRQLDETAARIAPGSDGLISINYLQGRFFPPDPSVRGLFIGHTWAHTRPHFYRAILESIAYDHYLTREIIRELLPRTTLHAVTAIGSGAKSELWMQIKADVLQAPYQSLERSDLSTLGSALLAGFSIGMFSRPEEATRRFVKPDKRIDPRPGADLSYRKSTEIYDELFHALKDVYRRIAS